MPQSSLHDWMRPRLETLFRQALAAGFEHDAALAVLIDVATSDEFNNPPLPAEPQSPHGPEPVPPEHDGDLSREMGVLPMPNLLGNYRQGPILD